MRPRVLLAVLFALLAISAAYSDTSVDEVNPPPSIVHILNDKSVETDAIKSKSSSLEIKEAEVKADVEVQTAKETPKLVEKKAEDVKNATLSDVEPMPAPLEKIEKDENLPSEIKGTKSAGKKYRKKVKTGRSGSLSHEDHEINGYVEFKAVNPGNRFPPNQMRPYRQQAVAQQGYGQVGQLAAATIDQERARRKRPSQNKNKKKNNKKRRTSNNNKNNKKKKEKKRTTPTKAPVKKPPNKNRRGTPPNHNNLQNAHYNNQHYNNHQNYKPNAHPNNNHHVQQPLPNQFNQHNQHNPHNIPQKNRRKATVAPLATQNHHNQKRQKQQPHKQNPNNRRKPTTKKPAARRRKQNHDGRPYNIEEPY